MDGSLAAKLSYTDFLQHLNSKAGNRIPSSLIDLVFDKLNMPAAALLTVPEFSNGYCLAVSSIQERVQAMRTTVLEHMNEIAGLKRKAVEAKAIEQHNEFGIMEGSLLVVEIKRASGLRRAITGEMPSPFVALFCEGISKKTKVKPKTTEPDWNELLNFEIKHGTSKLMLTVMNQDAPITDNILGDYSYELERLRDQNKRDETLVLSSRSQGAGQLILSLRWIFNKAACFEEMARQLQAEVDLERVEIDNLRQRLNLLHMPFSPFGPYYDWIILEHPSIRSSEVAIFSQLDTRIGRPLPWQSLMAFSVSVFICLTVLSMFARPDFPNLMLALGAYGLLKNGDGSFKQFKYLSLVFLLSEVYDIAWMFFFFSVIFPQAWAEGTFDHDVESVMQRFCLIVGLVDLVFKILLSFVAWRYALEVQAQVV